MRKPPGIPNELFTYERKKRHWTQGDIADKISAPDERMIRRWERGEVAPTPHYRGKLAEVFGKSARALGFPPDGQISFWYMPYRRNAFFTGREDILQLLGDTFLAQHSSPVPRLPLALSGLGGVGKSQIALEYAYRYREHYHTVLWLHAASYQGLIADVTAVADLLDLPGTDAAKPEQFIEALKERLTQLTRWLIIFDNIENLQMLEGFLPAEIKGHLLLTTRSQNTGTHAHRIAVEPLDNNTGAELLLHRAKLISIESTLEHMAAADAATARSLSADMGGLPLALDQAGAYVEETAVSLSEYVTRYQEEHSYLLNRRGSLVSEYSEHPIPVAATFMLSFEKAGEQHPLATDILRFCAFLQPDAIPEELFQYDDSFRYGTTAFDEGKEALYRYSLIKRNIQDRTYSMHRLVQAVLIDDMLPDLQKQWRERVLRTVNAAFPKAKPQEWGRCERLVSHALNCATWTADKLTPTAEAATLFHKAGKYLQERGRYSVAETLLARVLSIYEQHFDIEHPDTASALHDLAFNYFMQYKYGQSEPLYQQALAIQEKNLEAGHPAITRSLNHLALLYVMQGNYGLAESLIRRVLSIQTKNLEAGHADTTNTALTLAFLFFRQGKYRKTELSFLIAAEFEEIMDTNATAPLLPLVVFLNRRGEHELADQVYQYVLSIEEERLGATHPHIQETKRVFTDYMKSIGRDADAAALGVNNELSG